MIRPSDKVTLPKLKRAVIDVLRERGARPVLDELPVPEEGLAAVNNILEGRNIKVVLVDDSPSNWDKKNFDYYKDPAHPWRPVTEVPKGEVPDNESLIKV